MHVLPLNLKKLQSNLLNFWHVLSFCKIYLFLFDLPCSDNLDIVLPSKCFCGCCGHDHSYGSWIYNYLCNQCLSPQCCEFESCSDKVYSIQHYVTCGGSVFFFPGNPVSSSNKTDRHNITVESDIKHYNLTPSICIPHMCPSPIKLTAMI